ncbi:MAG: hypothetical protein ACFNS9_04740, partial [Actinomyces sp.]
MTLPPVLATTWVVIEYLIKIAALGTVPENRRPSSSTAWLLMGEARTSPSRVLQRLRATYTCPEAKAACASIMACSKVS